LHLIAELSRIDPQPHCTNVGHWKFSEVSVEIGERRDGDILVLSPAGRIDNDTSPAFQTRLLSAVTLAGAAVLVDFSAVKYISSAGLRALMMGSKQSKAAKGRLAIAALGPVVKEIFEISRFSLVVQVFDTPADAIAALR
jgi:anti-anti-sigma factor